MAKRARYTSGLSFYEEERKTGSNKIREIVTTLIYTVIAVFIAIVTVRFFGYRVSVIGSSMEPGLVNGQNVFVNRLAYRMSAPKRQDVIAFYPGGNENTHPSVKRVIAVPGDTIQVVDGVVLVNGIPESGSASYDKITDAGSAAQEEVLGSDEYFVLGDNRSNSEDSRSASIGSVQGSDIIGRVWLALSSGESGLHRVH